MQRNAIVDKTNAHRSRAKQTHDLLVEGKIPAHHIPAAIRQADADYLAITVLITNWHAQYSLSEVDCEENIRKATRAFNSLFDPHYKKPLDEIKAMTDIENSVAGGLLCHFRPYLHDKIKYISRVKMYLAKLSVQLNGHHQEDFIPFLRIHTSDSPLISDLRHMISNVKWDNDDAVLNVFEKINGKIAAANLDELPRAEKSFVTVQRKSLETFTFKSQELKSGIEARLV